MANKFTKSVLERQQKESTVQSRPAEPALVPAEPDTAPMPHTPSAAPPAPASSAVMPDLDSFLVQGQERSAKNKTFYLDTAVIQAIKRAASTRKVTESKLVNDILKKILAVEV